MTDSATSSPLFPIRFGEIDPDTIAELFNVLSPLSTDEKPVYYTAMQGIRLKSGRELFACNACDLVYNKVGQARNHGFLTHKNERIRAVSTDVPAEEVADALAAALKELIDSRDRWRDECHKGAGTWRDRALEAERQLKELRREHNALRRKAESLLK